MSDDNIDIEALLKEEAEKQHLQAALKRLNTQLQTHKNRTSLLVDAVYEAARDAYLLRDPIKVSAPPKRTRGKKADRSEVALWHLTDWQGGKLTPDYDSQVMCERVNRFVDKAIHIADIQRADHPVDECVILFGGDMIEGVMIFPHQPFEIDMNLFDQMFTVTDLIIEVVSRAAGNFNKVRVVSIKGNHGRVGKRHDAVSRFDNFDRMIYEIARRQLLHVPNIEWEIPGEEDILHVEIGSYKAILHHGDVWSGSAPSSMVRQANQWASGAYDKPFTDVYCVDEKTKALTPEGWKSYDEIGDDPIATLHPTTGAFEWQNPTNINKFEYQGPMHHIRGRSMDLFMTPNHTCWVRRRNHRNYQKVEAQDLPTFRGNLLYRVSSDQWKGKLSFPTDTPQRIQEANSLDVAEFFGWYISEGSSSKNQVSIAQDAGWKLDNREQIDKLIERLNYSTYGQQAQTRICNQELAAWMAHHFGAKSLGKRMPNWVKAWPKDHLIRLYTAAFDGDGTAPKGPYGSRTYTTTSERLRIDLQEVGLKIGRAATLAKGRYRSSGFGKNLIYEMNTSEVTERGFTNNEEIIPFEGIVWCPTVPNGLWFAQRNGRTTVSGNSAHFHSHLDLPMANGRGTIFQTGSTESTNRYANVGMAVTSFPSQRLHFIDPRKGHVTAQYKIRLDDED